MISSKMSAWVWVGLVATMMATAVEAQSAPTPSCVSKLVPCANYLNDTKPPASCCDPLRDAITNERQCLCRLYNDPSFLPSIGINISQALELPKHCNITGDLNACTATGAPGPSNPFVPLPPGVPGGENGNGAGKISWTGMSSVLLILASMMVSY